MGGDAKILAPTVEPVAVFMIDFDSGWSIEDETVKVDAAFAYVRFGVLISSALSILPGMRLDPFRIGGIDNGVFALGQGNAYSTHVVRPPVSTDHAGGC